MLAHWHHEASIIKNVIPAIGATSASRVTRYQLETKKNASIKSRPCEWVVRSSEIVVGSNLSLGRKARMVIAIIDGVLSHVAVNVCMSPRLLGAFLADFRTG